MRRLPGAPGPARLALARLALARLALARLALARLVLPLLVLPVLVLPVLVLVVLAGPASAANPVLDPEDDADVAAALAEATEVQGVCYGYVLTVSDFDTGEWGGTYAASSGGEGVPASSAGDCPGGVVELVASMVYQSSFSEAEDSASWQLDSTLGELTIADIENAGLSAEALLDDDRSATTLLNAVLSLPQLATEQAGLDPVVLEPNASPLPEGARPDDSPGSDWLRENGPLLALSVAALLTGLLALVASGPRRRTRAPRVTTFGPPPTGPARPGPARPGPAPSSRPTDPWRS